MKDDAKVEVVWEAPAPARTRSMYDAALAEVKRKPGSWARLRTFPGSSGAYSALSIRQRLGDPHWQAVARQIDGSEEWGLYVRYRTDEQMREAKR